MPSAARQTVTMLAVVLATLALGLSLTLGTMRLQDRAVASRFDRMADLVARRLEERMFQHIALLRATRSYFEAENGQVTVSEFARYVTDLNLERDYRGIQGIGYAPLLGHEAATAAAGRISRDNAVAIADWPPSDQARIAPIAKIEPMDVRNRQALGYDMFSDPIRRAAMTVAVETGRPSASGPVELVQEITAVKQSGFLIYVPTRVGLFEVHSGRDAGFVYAPFRAGDLHLAVLGTLEDLPLTVRTVDTADPGRPLFDNQPAQGVPDRLAAQAVTRDIAVAGRTWRLTLTPTDEFRDIRDRWAGLTVAALSLLLLIAVIGAMRSVGHALWAARQSAAQAARQAEERSLLLREMQHRIKNHIARIQAIARQTARGSADLAEYQRIFGARLSAMAKAQDALGRGAEGTADLRGLLSIEISQFMDAGSVEAALDGPPVRLTGREAQAMGLAAHELITNAMKYGPPPEEAGLRVTWDLVPDKSAPDRPHWLKLEWIEPKTCHDRTGATAPSGGFGSQLIGALIEGDLGGQFDRSFSDRGMVVTIAFPLGNN